MQRFAQAAAPLTNALQRFVHEIFEVLSTSIKYFIRFGGPMFRFLDF